MALSNKPYPKLIKMVPLDLSGRRREIKRVYAFVRELRDNK